MWIKVLVYLTIALVANARSEITCVRKDRNYEYLCSDAASFGSQTLPYLCSQSYPDYLILRSNNITVINNVFLSHCNSYEFTMINGSLQDILQNTFQSFTNLWKLDLSRNKINKLVNGAFFNNDYTNRKSLLINLSENQIATIEDGAFNTNIQYQEFTVNLSHNHLEDFNISSVADKNFKDVDLSFNKIGRLGSTKNEIFYGSLEFGHNQLNTFDLSILNNSRIDNLGLSFNNLSNVICESIVDNTIDKLNMTYNQMIKFNISCLGQSKKINFVDLRFSNIREVVAGGNRPFSIDSVWINNNSIVIFNVPIFANIIFLDVSFNRIKDFTCDATSKTTVYRFNATRNQINKFNISCIGHKNPMQFVDLSFNNISEIVTGVNRPDSIDYLFIQNNSIIYFDISYLAHIRIGVLDLSFNKIRKFACDSSSNITINRLINATHNQIVKFNLTCLGKNNQIKYVDLSFNQIEEITAAHQRPNKIDSMYLNHNKIKSFNMSYIADIKLTFLNISFNDITEISGNSRDQISIYKLDLSHNRIKSFNFSYLGTSSLTLLDLSINNISEIVDNPDRQPVINYLDLSHNSLKVLPEFSFPHSISFIDLSYNIIESIHIKTFFNLHGLRFLNLSNNRLENLRYGVFQNLDQLETLDLSNNRLVSKDLLTVYGLNSLKTFYFHNNQIEFFKFQNFPLNLQKVSLYGNKLNFTCLEFHKLLRLYNRIEIIEGQEFDQHHVRGISCNHNPEEDESPKRNITEKNHADPTRYFKDSSIVDVLRNLTDSFNNLSKSNIMESKKLQSLTNNFEKIIKNTTKEFLEAFDRIEEKRFDKLLESFKLMHSNHHEEDQSTSKIVKEDQENFIQNELHPKKETSKENHDDQESNPNKSSFENQLLNIISNQLTLLVLLLIAMLLIACIAFVIWKYNNLKRFCTRKNCNQDQEEHSTQRLISPDAQELTEM